MTLLKGLSPMLAVPGSLPVDEGGWAYEVKFDGVRVLAEVADGRVTLHSRNGNDVTAAYPELQPLAAQLGHGWPSWTVRSASSTMPVAPTSG